MTTTKTTPAEGATYWTVDRGGSEYASIRGSRHGVRVNPPFPEWPWGRVFTSRAMAEAFQDERAADQLARYGTPGDRGRVVEVRAENGVFRILGGQR